MPPLDWDPQGQAFAFISVSLHLAKHLDHRHLSVCWMNAVLRKSKARRLHFFNTDHFISNFVLLGRILKIKCLHTKYCSIRITVFPESHSPLSTYSEVRQHDSSEFSLLLFKNINTGRSVLRFNSQDL